MKMLPSDTKRMAAFLNEQLRYFKKLLVLSVEQKRAIRNDDMETVKIILYKKDKIIEEFKDVQEYYKLAGVCLSKLVRSPEINDSIKKIDDVLEKLRLIEAESEEILSKKCMEVKEEINQTKRSRKIISKFNIRSEKSQLSEIIDEKA